MITTAPSLIIAVAILVSLFKIFLETKVKVDNPVHDALIWISSLLVGVLLNLGNYLLTYVHLNRVGAVNALEQGFVAGIVAMLMYHLQNSNILNQLSPDALSNMFNALSPEPKVSVPEVVTSVSSGSVQAPIQTPVVQSPSPVHPVISIPSTWVTPPTPNPLTVTFNPVPPQTMSTGSTFDPSMVQDSTPQVPEVPTVLSMPRVVAPQDPVPPAHG